MTTARSSRMRPLLPLSGRTRLKTGARRRAAKKSLVAMMETLLGLGAVVGLLRVVRAEVDAKTGNVVNTLLIHLCLSPLQQEGTLSHYVAPIMA
jgi:hypothetical protein